MIKGRSPYPMLKSAGCQPYPAMLYGELPLILDQFSSNFHQSWPVIKLNKITEYTHWKCKSYCKNSLDIGTLQTVVIPI